MYIFFNTIIKRNKKIYRIGFEDYCQTWSCNGKRFEEEYNARCGLWKGIAENNMDASENSCIYHDFGIIQTRGGLLSHV